jgi:hypothetical protein
MARLKPSSGSREVSCSPFAAPVCALPLLGAPSSAGRFGTVPQALSASTHRPLNSQRRNGRGEILQDILVVLFDSGSGMAWRLG